MASSEIKQNYAEDKVLLTCGELGMQSSEGQKPRARSGAQDSVDGAQTKL